MAVTKLWRLLQTLSCIVNLWMQNQYTILVVCLYTNNKLENRDKKIKFLEKTNSKCKKINLKNKCY